MQILTGIAIAFAVVGVLFLAFAVSAWRKRRRFGAIGSTGTGALFLSLAALFATLGAATQGYRGLTQEEVALTVTTVPTGPAAFQAFLEFPDGRDTTLQVSGDQLLVDAHILKWHYIGNVIGYHTQYELDRLSGRYIDIDAERTMPRTVHSLKSDKPLDLFELARCHVWLRFLVDTEYGSATYIEVRKPARFEVLVSTTGLLVRESDFR